MNHNYAQSIGALASARTCLSKIVAIVASAGGVEAISAILAGLPGNFAIPILVVQHLSPEHPSMMAHILAQRTSLIVREATSGERILPGNVYIAPPNRHMLVNQQGVLSLSDSPKVRYSRPSGDVMFKSVSDAYRDSVIAIVLTGGDGDGTAGIEDVKLHGGVTIAQDKGTSLNFSMPHSAIDTGDVDLILPPDQIANALIALVM